MTNARATRARKPTPAARAAVKQTDGNGQIVQIQVAMLRPAPENATLYRAISESDPEIIALAKSIKRHGVLEPLLIDHGYRIIGGHRRHVAARFIAGLGAVGRGARCDCSIRVDGG